MKYVYFVLMLFATFILHFLSELISENESNAWIKLMFIIILIILGIGLIWAYDIVMFDQIQGE